MVALVALTGFFNKMVNVLSRMRIPRRLEHIMYIDTWHFQAKMSNGYILTCYGIKGEAHARNTAKQVLDSMGEQIISCELAHATKETPRSRLSRELFKLK